MHKTMLIILLINLILTGCQSTAPGATDTPAVSDTPMPTFTPSPDPPVTLEVPTRVSYPTPEPTARPEVSRIRYILDEGVLRVGIKLNAPPLGTLDREGNIVGYDADIARALAESWGVELQLIQVTDQTAFDYLLGGGVDLLIAAMPHRREYEAFMSFSQSYFPDGQAVMVRADGELWEVGQLAGERVAVVTGSRATEALNARGLLDVEVVAYDILDDAVAAMVAGEVAAVVDTLVNLRNAAVPGVTRIFDALVRSAPLAIGLPRHDVNLRNALNRTLQALERSGRMKEIHDAWFGGYDYPGMVAWKDEDPRDFAEYPTDIFYVESVVARLARGEPLRVAGLSQDAVELGEGEQRIEAFYRGLVEALAASWSVSVEFLPGSQESPVVWVADGRADLAVGVEPTWDGADMVSYGQPFLLHGNRMVVLKDSTFNGFGDLRGKRVAVFGARAVEDEARALELAESVRLRLASVTQYSDVDAAILALQNNRADAVFGDSLALGPFVASNPEALRFTERFYSLRGTAFAMPRADVDFRSLVNFSLQDLVQDGTYDQLLEEMLNWAESLPVEIWPGDGSWLWE